ncbi:MAG: hypothetical protein ACYCZB_04650 [Acidiphilium sp.]
MANETFSSRAGARFLRPIRDFLRETDHAALMYWSRVAGFEGIETELNTLLAARCEVMEKWHDERKSKGANARHDAEHL